MTKKTSRLRAWSDRILLTPVLRGLGWLLRPVWLALRWAGQQIWRWLLRPVWLVLRWAGQQIWRWLLRPVWLALRWAGRRIWRWPLKPLWRRLLRPVWLVLRWAGRHIWRWLLRPVWLALQRAGRTLRSGAAALLAAPWLLARTLPNRGWAAGAVVVAFAGAVLFFPGVLNAKTAQRSVPISEKTQIARIGENKPETTVNLGPFDGWNQLVQYDPNLLQLKHGQATLMLLRHDALPDPAKYYDWYLHNQLGVSEQREHNIGHQMINTGSGRRDALRVREYYKVPGPRHGSDDRYYGVVLTSYDQVTLIVVLSTDGRENTSFRPQLDALIASIRIAA